jgi:cytochrome P450
VYANLAAELDAVLGGRAPVVADVPRLPYVDAVLQETMRLYPPAAMMAREARRDCAIGGYRVRRGTTVLVSQWVMHRDPRYFDDPDTFNPDRWSGELAKRLPRYAYFPFGGGQRMCIDSGFAKMEAALVLATMAQQFRPSLVPGHPVVPSMAITLRPQHGMPMVLHRRQARAPLPACQRG